MESSSPFCIAVLISGSGSTLDNLIQLVHAGQLPIEISLVVSSNPTAGGLEFARAADIPAISIERSDFPSTTAFSEAIFTACRKSEVDLVVLGGFIKRLSVPQDFTNRIINVHPSLIPAFCGQGFYGTRVHQAVLEYGCKLSGCTVHFVDDHYDHGPIIAQQAVEVLSSDAPSDLAARVQASEREIFPQVIRNIAEGRIRVEGRSVIIET
jgi:phosphoribosylglycinamide formyltransferase-1